MPVRSPCYYRVTFHRTRNPSRSIREYNDLRCSRFFLPLSLFLYFHRPFDVANTFSSSGNTSNYRGHTARVPRILSDVRSLEKNIIDGRRFFRGYSSTLSIRFIIVLLHDSAIAVSSSRARYMPRPHRYKSNLLLLETRFIVIFDSMQVNRAAFSSFFLSHRVTRAFLSPLYRFNVDSFLLP